MKSPSILFIIPYPPGEAPSQRFRFEQYLALLEKSGFAITLQSFWSPSVWRILYKKGHLFRKITGFTISLLRRIIILPTLPRYSFIFIHREAAPLGPPIIEWLIAKVFRKKIIYDFDDAIWLPNTSDHNNIISTIKWHGKAKAICKWSYKVSCGNDYLADFARNYNSRVILNPSTVDTGGLHSQKENNSSFPLITLGWTGTHSTAPFLFSIENVIKSLEKKYPSKFRFLIIADEKPLMNIDSLQFLPWTKFSERDDLQKIDIGIMPLPDNQWTKGKGGFKILQYMAMGIPAVASPVGVNKKIITHGMNGFLCETDEEWIKHLEQLILSEQLRKKMGQAGRDFVISNYSVTSNASNFLSLFE